MGGVRSDQVLALLDRLTTEGLTAWVDGGWGVDALLEEQTREHGDLDLVVEDIAIGRLTSLLVDEGFEVVRDWLPTSIAFRHPDGRELDLHPVELTEDGGGDQVQLDGERRWHYAPPTMGRIGGRLVACCTVETEIASHLGYEPDENDFRDMRALAERFGCVLSPPYGSVNADDVASSTP